MNIGQSLCFDDVLMEPLLSKISTRSSINLESNIATNGRTLILKTPLISSPMDTVTETDMAIKMALNGGIGIIHRFMDIDDQVSQITKVKRFLQYIIQEPYKILPTTTFIEIEDLCNLYNVSTFCVVDNINTNKLLGIITKRDIEYMKQKQYEIKTTTSYCDGINGIHYNDIDNDNDIILEVNNFMTQNVITLSLSISL